MDLTSGQTSFRHDHNRFRETENDLPSVLLADRRTTPPYLPPRPDRLSPRLSPRLTTRSMPNKLPLTPGAAPSIARPMDPPSPARLPITGDLRRFGEPFGTYETYVTHAPNGTYGPSRPGVVHPGEIPGRWPRRRPADPRREGRRRITHPAGAGRRPAREIEDSVVFTTRVDPPSTLTEIGRCPEDTPELRAVTADLVLGAGRRPSVWRVAGGPGTACRSRWRTWPGAENGTGHQSPNRTSPSCGWVFSRIMKLTAPI
ncbi:hypothetical protein GCM10022223_60350 [Kineosporia mesophila]|uniref:Uncharacterized protein n=1 Tax=Kineosporia mesophila TaxID=566012 RepID=A0ABP7AKF2_9ACTN